MKLKIYIYLAPYHTPHGSIPNTPSPSTRTTTSDHALNLLLSTQGWRRYAYVNATFMENSIKQGKKQEIKAKQTLYPFIFISFSLSLSVLCPSSSWCPRWVFATLSPCPSNCCKMKKKQWRWKEKRMNQQLNERHICIWQATRWKKQSAITEKRENSCGGTSNSHGNVNSNRAQTRNIIICTTYIPSL